MVEHPHDHLVRAVFGDPARAAALLRGMLPVELLARLDLATLQAVPGSFVDPELRGRVADLLFTVEPKTTALARARGGPRAAGQPSGEADESTPRLIHLLIEHQSSIDRWLPLRLLDYQRAIWERWRREHADTRKLPRIVPAVLYHGDHAWPAPADFAHLVAAHPEEQAGSLDFRFHLTDLTQISDGKLRSTVLDAAALLALLALKHARTATDLRERVIDWVELMNSTARAPGGRAALMLVLRYLSITGERIGRDFLHHEIAPRLVDPGAKETAMTMGEELIAEGHDLGQRDLLLKQLRRRFGELPEAVVAQVRAAPSEQIEVWALRILDARSLSEALAEA